MRKVLLIFPGTPQSVIDRLKREVEVISPIDSTDDWQTAMRDVDAVITVVQP